MSEQIVVDIYEKLLSDLIRQEAHLAHRALKIYGLPTKQNGCDIHGNTQASILASTDPTANCLSCGRILPAQRFAQHLEKCMGLSNGRAASRANRTNVADSQDSLNQDFKKKRPQQAAASQQKAQKPEISHQELQASFNRTQNHNNAGNNLSSYLTKK